MSTVRFGIKLWSTNSDVLPLAAKLIDEDLFGYVELNPVPDTDITPFLDYDIPYIIHITTERHGLNIADPDKRMFNIRTITDCFYWADKLCAPYCILHPGFGEIECALEFLEQYSDQRLLIENMPMTGISDEKMVGYLLEQVEELMNRKFGFCFDINHAIKAAVSLKEPYREFVRKFLRLNPAMFHIADGHLSQEKDEHLHIGKGDYDFGLLTELIQSVKPSMVTLETPRNPGSVNDDLMNRDAIMAYLG
jgi:deoxyribonuclease-4